MVRSRLDVAASTFKLGAEGLHSKFLKIVSDTACTGCQSAGFGEAILAAWLQNEWINFTRNLIVASALGTRRTRGTPVRPIAGVTSLDDAEKRVRAAAASEAKQRGSDHPIWHMPAFTINVGALLGLNNQLEIEAALGATLVPGQITAFRNYLVHPGTGTRQKYDDLQVKLGMHRLDPEHLLHQHQRPGLHIFTSWVRELQQIADASTQ